MPALPEPALTPRCPECGELPELILQDGHALICPTPGCPVEYWDSHLSPDQNRERRLALGASSGA